MLARRAVLTLITPPAAAAISLATVKRRLHIDHNADDDELTGIIAACVAFLDGSHGLLGRCLINQTWEERFERWPCGPLELALSPVGPVTSVQYIDPAGVEQTIPLPDLDIASNGDTTIIAPLTAWPAVDQRRAFPIRVRYVAGYGAAEAAIPATIREAIMLHVGSLYERRDALSVAAVSITPLGYDDLISGHRRPSL